MRNDEQESIKPRKQVQFDDQNQIDKIFDAHEQDQIGRPPMPGRSMPNAQGSHFAKFQQGKRNADAELPPRGGQPDMRSAYQQNLQMR